MINDSYKANFETMRRAFQNDDVVILEAMRAHDQKPVVLVCAMQPSGDGEDGDKRYDFVPLAQLIDGNPYELFYPPHPDGGFVHPDGSVHDEPRTVDSE